MLQKQKECRSRESTVSVSGKSKIIVHKLAIASGAGGRIESRSSRQEIPVLNRQLLVQDVSRTSIGLNLLLASGVNPTVINDHAVFEDIGNAEAECTILSGSRNPIVDDSRTPTSKVYPPLILSQDCQTLRRWYRRSSSQSSKVWIWLEKLP